MSAFPNGAGEGPTEDLEGQPQGAGEGAADRPGEGPGEHAEGSSGLGTPEPEMARVAAERDEYLEALRRLQAEFDNYRKRMTRQQTELLDRATEGLLERLLPVLDAIDLAQQHGAGAGEGPDDGAAFAQIASLLKDALARDGLERIDAAGVRFDPAIHDAVAHLPAAEPATEPPARSGEQAAGEAPGGEAPGGEAPGGEGVTASATNGATEAAAPPAGPSPAVVAEVLRAGYRLKGRVLRPAMVTVQG